MAVLELKHPLCPGARPGAAQPTGVIGALNPPSEGQLVKVKRFSPSLALPAWTSRYHRGYGVEVARTAN